MNMAHDIPIPIPTSSKMGKRTEQLAARLSLCQAAGPDLPAVETQPPITQHNDCTPSTPPRPTPLEGTANFLLNLPIKTCVELTWYLF